MTDTALVPSSSALDIYGSGEDIKQLAKRIQLCLPGGSRLQMHEALSLAQLSVAYDLNPFNGEVWFIPGSGPMVGIKGIRKAARKQGRYWVEHQLLAQQERDALKIPNEAIAYRALVYRSEMLVESAQAIKLMHDAGMEDAANRYAYQPSIGVGYWTVGEKTKMKGDQAARKRAEAEALKVAFDLPFASDMGNGERVGYVDAEWEIIEPNIVDFPPSDTEDVEDHVPESYSPPQDLGERPMSAEVVRRTVRDAAGWKMGQRIPGNEPSDKQKGYVAGLMEDALKPETGLRSQKEKDNIRHAVLEFILKVNSTNQLYSSECSAIIDWLKDADGAGISQWAQDEVNAVYAAWLKAQGQMEMEMPPL